jgi:RNA polymerase sigma factor (sigma-70 family)
MRERKNPPASERRNCPDGLWSPYGWPMRDHEIVAAIVAGDPAGLAAAYDGYAAPLHAYCRSLLAEPADAADAVQDTFVIAAAKVGDLREPDRLRPWLYAVARNECYRRLRGQARFAPLDAAGDVSDTQADASTTAGRAELRDLVAAALAGLNPSDREVIELNLRHEVEGRDLADALGVPLNQAHALASRARGQLERSLGVLLVARTGREACAELDAMLADWDGTLTILLRKRVSRHIENCEICGERKRRELSPAALFSVLPLVGLPAGLRRQVLQLVADRSPAAAGYRAAVVGRAGRFGQSGFPVQLSPAGRAPKRALRAHPVPYAVAAAVIVLAASGSAAYALRHDHAAASRHHHRAAAAVTITVSAKPAATTAQSTPAQSTSATSAATAHATARPTTAPAVPPSSPIATVSPTPNVSPGTLQLSSDTVKVPAGNPTPYLPPFTGTFTLTAVGGPVTYSISVPSSEQAYLTLTPSHGTLQAGQQQTVTVTVLPAPSPAPRPPYVNTVTVNPGSVLVTIHYLPSG